MPGHKAFALRNGGKTTFPVFRWPAFPRIILLSGNRDLRDGRSREHLVDIANLAMIEFAEHTEYLLRRRRLCRAKNTALQVTFKTPASPLQGFFSIRRVSQAGAKTRSRAKTFPNLASFGGVGAKSFQTQIRGPKFRPKAFKFP